MIGNMLTISGDDSGYSARQDALRHADVWTKVYWTKVLYAEPAKTAKVTYTNSLFPMKSSPK